MAAGLVILGVAIRSRLFGGITLGTSCRRVPIINGGNVRERRVQLSRPVVIASQLGRFAVPSVASGSCWEKESLNRWRCGNL